MGHVEVRGPQVWERGMGTEIVREERKGRK